MLRCIHIAAFHRIQMIVPTLRVGMQPETLRVHSVPAINLDQPL